MSGQYNGWSNYETWLAALWIGEGYAGGSDYVAEIAAEILTDNEGDTDEAADTLADTLRNDIDETWTTKAAGLEADLLRAAVEEINWHEIARHYVDEARADAIAEA
ncbi:MAG: hypothetical protein EB116_18890 [Betaproteobacteria bacterium]|nr:hypothetical protein [Betaproteobacteria bacterium]